MGMMCVLMTVEWGIIVRMGYALSVDKIATNVCGMGTL